MKPILSISEAEVSQALSVRKSIQLGRQAYVKRAMERILEPPRTWFTIPGGASFYFMPAHVLGLETVSVKVVAVNSRSRHNSVPTISATIYVSDSKTGSPLDRIEGAILTAIRPA